MNRAAPDIPVPLQAGGTARGYREHLVTGEVQVLECTDTGEPIAVLGGQFIYVAAWLDASALQRLLQTACTLENATLKMPDGLRRRATATETFWFNYSGQQQVLDGQSYPPLSVTRQSWRPTARNREWSRGSCPHLRHLAQQL
ncbi:MAG: hypothetical protein R3E95_11715 [Thiolinea sp.]